MVTYKPFSIVVIPFPFTDQPKTKRRPALVLSSINYQQQTRHISLLMITSAKNSSWYDDYAITSLPSTGLNSPSVIRQKLFTLDSRLIIRATGELATTDKNNVIKIIKKHLSIN